MNIDQDISGSNESSEKLPVEGFEDVLDHIAHLVEHYNGLLPLEPFDLCKRYADGRLKLCVHLRIGGRGHEVYLFARAINQEIKTESVSFLSKRGSFAFVDLNHAITIGVLDHELATVLRPPSIYGASHCYNLADLNQVSDRKHANSRVFIVPIRVMQKPEKVIASLVWLELVDHLNGADREPFYFFSDAGVRFISVSAPSDGEEGVLTGASVEHRDGTRHVIERGAKIMKNSANLDLESERGRLELECPDFIPHDIEVRNDFIRLRSVEGFDVPIEVLDVGFGNVRFRERHFH